MKYGFILLILLSLVACKSENQSKTSSEEPIIEIEPKLSKQEEKRNKTIVARIDNEEIKLTYSIQKLTELMQDQAMVAIKGAKLSTSEIQYISPKNTYYLLSKGKVGQEDFTVRTALVREGNNLRVDQQNITESCTAENGCMNVRFREERNGCRCDSESENPLSRHSIALSFEVKHLY